MNEYIQQKNIDSLNNYQLLIFATEHYTQFMYFLEDFRGYKNFEIKIGNFKYDEWEADIYCILDKTGVYFKHIERDTKKEFKHRTLTEQFIYAWDFEETNFNITFDIINNLWKLLNNKEREAYSQYYDEVHAEMW